MVECPENPVREDLPARRLWPSKLFVETTTRCNLRCVMCVKETWDASCMEGDMDDATFTALEPAFSHLDALILNGVGEPLLDQRLERFIRRAKELMPPGSLVGFQSNGMLLDEERAVALLMAGLDRICISADALDPEVFRRIRRGGEEQGVERALVALHSAKVLSNRPDFAIGLEFVLMRDNIAELPDLLRRASTLGVSFAIVTHVVAYAEGSVGQMAFDANMDGAVQLFEEWQECAAREGLCLDDYFTVLWKYMRRPSDGDLALFLAELAHVVATDGLVGVRGILGSCLPSKQITIKDFADTRNQLEQLFGDDAGWRDALERIYGVLNDEGLQGANAREHAKGLLDQWRQAATAGTTGLVDYLTVLWKYSRTPREQRIYDLVEELKGEARARNISLHLKNLLQRDVAWTTDLERVFAEAQAVARETGLQLTLPNVSPSSERCCPFVEEGSAFVSWNGNVHPCYFLWHEYGCHLFGRKKSVTAKQFGTVTRQALVDIWNSREFRAFRDEVLAYDFPYCSNCNVVPCQYLQADEFEQDCYGNSVPCGDCFWCMGMFNCLH